jgi:hypothetical protein
VGRLKLKLFTLQQAELEGQYSGTWLEAEWLPSHVSHHWEGEVIWELGPYGDIRISRISKNMFGYIWIFMDISDIFSDSWGTYPK